MRVSGIRRLLNLPESGRRVQRDVDDEIRFHLESRVAELVARGTPADVARDIAAREFGDVAEARAEIARVDQRRLTRERRQAWWETLGQDLAYSARSLRIAARVRRRRRARAGVRHRRERHDVRRRSTACCCARRRTSPIRDASSVSASWADASTATTRQQRVLSYPIYRDMRSAASAFEQVAAYSPDDMAIRSRARRA